jgi:hypothetical protein
VGNLIDVAARVEATPSRSLLHLGHVPGGIGAAATGAHTTTPDRSAFSPPPSGPRVAPAPSHVSVESSSPRPSRDARETHNDRRMEDARVRIERRRYWRREADEVEPRELGQAPLDYGGGCLAFTPHSTSSGVAREISDQLVWPIRWDYKSAGVPPALHHLYGGRRRR